MKGIDLLSDLLWLFPINEKLNHYSSGQDDFLTIPIGDWWQNVLRAYLGYC